MVFETCGKKDNPAVLQVTMDITIDSHVKRAFRLTMERFGTVDVIINNGGMRARDLYPDSSGMTQVIDTEVGEDRGQMMPGGIEAGWEVTRETMAGA